MDLALVTIGAGILSAWPWMAARYSWAHHAWERIAPAEAAVGIGLIAYAVYHLTFYGRAILDAFGYVPMLAFACSLGLIVDGVIGVRFALPALQRFATRRAGPDAHDAWAVSTLREVQLHLRRHEAWLGAGALALGVLSLLSLMRN